MVNLDEEKVMNYHQKQDKEHFTRDSAWTYEHMLNLKYMWNFLVASKF